MGIRIQRLPKKDFITDRDDLRNNLIHEILFVVKMLFRVNIFSVIVRNIQIPQVVFVSNDNISTTKLLHDLTKLH
jgi:hypothetical protein